MKINHVAVYVTDLEKVRTFYEKYFHAKSNRMYHNQKTGLKTYFLEFDGECRIEIMTKGNLNNRAKELDAIGYMHNGFTAGNKNNVDELTKKIEK
ncbi:VOC family protein [Treponema endosymbiont of Eucomonympha sp.]|uniref:VOC family protein n=1 Tax=Treponema endosymbiont of Eucomonympha sp. TaxID=1580831 RepID=UPI000AEB7B5B|nr:VOC family protein [Treponema endosymbiont of Eucomonympha sp.]